MKLKISDFWVGVSGARKMKYTCGTKANTYKVTIAPITNEAYFLYCLKQNLKS
jgi:hypothetical protein